MRNRTEQVTNTFDEGSDEEEVADSGDDWQPDEDEKPKKRKSAGAGPAKAKNGAKGGARGVKKRKKEESEEEESEEEVEEDESEEEVKNVWKYALTARSDAWLSQLIPKNVKKSRSFHL